MKTVSGSCLCGDISFECNDDFSQFHFCHCTQCQKISGSAHVANLFTRLDNIIWLSGEKEVQRYDVPERDISNAFCKKCGSAVPYISKSEKSLIVPAGSLDIYPSIKAQDNIFWSEHAEWYEDGIKSTRFDGFPK